MFVKVKVSTGGTEGDRRVMCSFSQENHGLSSSNKKSFFCSWVTFPCYFPHLTETLVSSITPVSMFCHAPSPHLRVLHLLLTAHVLSEDPVCPLPSEPLWDQNCKQTRWSSCFRKGSQKVRSRAQDNDLAAQLPPYSLEAVQAGLRQKKLRWVLCAQLHHWDMKLQLPTGA